MRPLDTKGSARCKVIHWSNLSLLPLAQSLAYNVMHPLGQAKPKVEVCRNGRFGLISLLIRHHAVGTVNLPLKALEAMRSRSSPERNHQQCHLDDDHA